LPQWDVFEQRTFHGIRAHRTRQICERRALAVELSRETGRIRHINELMAEHRDACRRAADLLALNIGS
jgi:hypothetical protein